MGLSSFTWDIPLPGKRPFINFLAREFASRVETLGFEKLEWWNGRDWREAQGRFHILHDTVYDKYHMCLKVAWLGQPPAEEKGLMRARLNSSDFTNLERQSSSMLEQIEQTLERQRQFLDQALSNQQRAADAQVDRSLLKEAYRNLGKDTAEGGAELSCRELCGT